MNEFLCISLKVGITKNIFLEHINKTQQYSKETEK